MFDKALLRSLRKSKGLSQGKLAEMCGVHLVTVSNWERGQKQPETENVTKLATALGVSTDYLMGRSDSPSEARPAPSSPDKKTPPADLSANGGKEVSFFMVPVYNTIVKASAGVGNGYADDSYRPDVIDEICIMDKSLLGLYGSNLHAIQVDGDSMEPIIENGDYVVYTETQDWTTGCLMVVRLDTRLYVKGMRLKGNTLVLRSANPDYSDIIVGDDTTFEIIGRVVKIVPPQRDPEAVY